MSINPLRGTGTRRFTRLHLKHQRDAARSAGQVKDGTIRALDTQVAGLTDELALNRADLTETRKQLVDQRELEVLIAGLRKELKETKASLANATKVSDLQQHISTAPSGTNVRDLRAYFAAAGRVVPIPLHQSPLADPGHVPSPADSATTQSIRLPAA
ncbi:hypothetical protein [Streptomyces sp. H27-D2]|uniref:hypothetical protein n=1 Tax=Streptomyces sp. H27-D2 TaxID=3046304 RepID=UPI002DB84F60|nr:hypothetical protein [Streptomyces sp. H27-D2]MEC4016017.1 hypothetical protein [Streptomyces sp. H27-D2]